MKRVGKYVVCGLLGKGGMSVVYKAGLPFLNKIVALKLLSPHPNLTSLLGPEAIRTGFISEAAALASLRHPNIIDLLDFDFDEDRPFFTMEYYYNDLGRLIGETCRTEMPSRILSLDKTIHYCRQLLAGLARLRRAGIVHRDIKPANLMITGDDCIKICDFGFSRLRGERPGTPSNLMVGSPFYAAPEQEKEPDAVDHRADLYSAGVIAHRMLTGFLPEDGVRNPENYHPEADSSWGPFVGKALEKNPEDRFTAPEEMLAALEELSAAWEKKKLDVCRLSDGRQKAKGGRQKIKPGDELLVAGPGLKNQKLRNTPLKISPKEASSLFGCDRLMRPLDYNDDISGLTVEKDVVFDCAKGLVWQRSGAEDPLDRSQAQSYCKSLSAEAFGGFWGWRLPTVDELLSLLRRPGFGVGDCFLPAFDTRQTILWSCDRCAFVSGWYVNMELGFAGYADFTCRFHVRAVADARGASIVE